MRSTVSSLTKEEEGNSDVSRWKDLFMNNIAGSIGDYTKHVVPGESIDANDIYRSALCDEVPAR